MSKEKILFSRKISKMSYEDLKYFRKNCTEKEKEDLEILVNNPIFELYNENKDLSKIEFEDRIINLDFNNLKLDDSLIDSKYFTVVKGTEIFRRLYYYTTKQIIYYRISAYLKGKSLNEDFKKSSFTNTAIKQELKELSRLKTNLISYINKQKTIYNDTKKIRQDFIMENHLRGFYSVDLNDNQIRLYKDILQDVRDTKGKLIKHSKIQMHKIATEKYHLFDDLNFYVGLNYEYQKELLKEKIEILENEIENFDIYKEGLSQKKSELKKLQEKIKDIPIDKDTKVEHFLNSLDLDLKIDSKNKNKYNTHYLHFDLIYED